MADDLAILDEIAEAIAAPARRTLPEWDARFAPLALLDRRASSLGCANCGACCVGVMLSWHPQRREEATTRYYAEHWRVLWVDNPRGYPGPAYVIECDSYDAEHARCGDYDNRPVACRGYPWYETPPVAGGAPDHPLVAHRVDGVASCSYYLDAPGWSSHGARPLLPIVDATRSAREVYSADVDDLPKGPPMSLRNAAGTVLTRAQVLALANSATPPAEYTFTADVYEDAEYEGSTEQGRVLKWSAGQTVPLTEIDETYGVPTVTAIAPANGAAAGGTNVTITGTNFVRGSEVIPGGATETATATVTVGGVACTNVKVVSDTEITATTGAHAAGAGDVIVTAPAGASAALAGGFTFA